MLKINKISLDFRISHRNWEAALAEAFALLISASPGEVVCIAGPSRAGKTRLIAELVRLLSGNNNFEVTGELPVVVVDAENTGPNGSFSTKDFAARMLDSARHPLLSMSSDGVFESDFSQQKIDLSTEAKLKKALVRALIFRKTKYLFIDEAQHVRYVSKKSQAPEAYMDSWKCLAKAANVVLVIVGAYPILEIIAKSAHLLGRKHQVHLARYKYEADDLKEFAAIISIYEEKLEIQGFSNGLLQHAELLYRGTFGCIGLLRGWLLRAAAKAAVSKSVITEKTLKETCWADKELAVISAEIIEGERFLAVSEGKKTSIKNASEEGVTQKRGNQKPFQQKPKRRSPGHRTEAQA